MGHYKLLLKNIIYVGCKLSIQLELGPQIISIWLVIMETLQIEIKTDLNLLSKKLEFALGTYTEI